MAGSFSKRGSQQACRIFNSASSTMMRRTVQPFGGDGGAHLRVHGEADGLVNVALLPLHLDALDDFGLGRQFARDLIFCPAQQKRFDPTREMARAFRVAFLFDGRAKCVGEPGAIAQKARRHHVEQRP